jgi:hypothetical protein
MIMIPDRTGRFPRRPHYQIDELETACDEIVANFATRHYGQLVNPVSTPMLVELLEDEAATVNLYCDLSVEGEEIHGLTEFSPGSKPSVSIARELSYQHWREHRLRTTLAHEYCHVHWHAWLYDRYCLPCSRHKCARGKLLPHDGELDWMEWQAGYICCALLIPRSRAALSVTAFCAERDLHTPLARAKVEGRLLIARTSVLFNVSLAAAEVRLGQLGYLN